MAITSDRQYLMDYLKAELFMYRRATNINTLAKVRESMSFKARGILNKPMAPLLVLAGALDTQVPISDIEC